MKPAARKDPMVSENQEYPVARLVHSDRTARSMSGLVQSYRRDPWALMALQQSHPAFARKGPQEQPNAG